MSVSKENQSKSYREEVIRGDRECNRSDEEHLRVHNQQLLPPTSSAHWRHSSPSLSLSLSAEDLRLLFFSGHVKGMWVWSVFVYCLVFFFKCSEWWYWSKKREEQKRGFWNEKSDVVFTQPVTFWCCGQKPAETAAGFPSCHFPVFRRISYSFSDLKSLNYH